MVDRSSIGGAHATFVGVDLAWGPNGRTGLAAVDERGQLRAVACVSGDEEIVSWVREQAPGACLVAIDAPLVVVNATGQRNCERLVARHFGRFGVFCHSSNTGNRYFAGSTRGQRLSAALELDVDPASIAPRRAVEVYPHPALVALFGLPRILRYKAKPGRDLEFLVEETTRLLDLLEGLETSDVPLRLRGHPDWERIRADAKAARRKSDLARVEDVIDAVVCAYIAKYWAQAPEKTRVLGSFADGYIVTPVTPEIARRLDQATADDNAGPQAADPSPAEEPTIATSQRPEPARAESGIVDIRDRMRAFSEERDWEQFHDPKSLILALTGEVGELAELFQWLPADEAADAAADEPLRTRVGEELADVLIYLVRLADVLGIDLSEAAHRKLRAVEARFPVDENYGQAPLKR